jgi:hypothetical protein
MNGNPSNKGSRPVCPRYSVASIAVWRPLSVVEQCCRWIEAAIGSLIEETKTEKACMDSYAIAAMLLESVPLPTDEFLLAKLRLMNARIYARNHEFGAASFELRQLRRQIESL